MMRRGLRPLWICAAIFLAWGCVTDPSDDAPRGLDLGVSGDGAPPSGIDAGDDAFLPSPDSGTADAARDADSVKPDAGLDADRDVDVPDVSSDAAEPMADAALVGDAGSVDSGREPDGGRPADAQPDVVAGDVGLDLDSGVRPDAEPVVPDIGVPLDQSVDAALPDARVPREEPVRCAGENLLEPPCNGCPEGTVVPPNWACVPGGDFWMGRDEGSLGEPRHRVRLTRPFLVMATEVTLGMWLSAEYNGRNFVIPGIGEPCPDCDADRRAPVGGMDFDEAVGFANALSLADGLEPCYQLLDCLPDPPGTQLETYVDEMGVDVELRPWCQGIRVPTGSVYTCEGYRLPTEAEWEMAARAGEEGLTYGPVDEIGWYGGNSRGPQPVGQKRPNAFGLYDVLGNVGERAWDDHHPEYWGVGVPEIVEPSEVDPEFSGNTDPVISPAYEPVGRGGSYASGRLDIPGRAGGTVRSRPYFRGIRLVRSLPAIPCGCSDEDVPACGVNGTTYGNPCLAECAAVPVAHDGPCADVCLNPNDPIVDYVGDEAQCARIRRFRCPTGQAPFRNACGCGCAGQVLECWADEDCGVPGATCQDARCALPEPCLCPGVAVEPVCGNDGASYDNECLARCAGARARYPGECGDRECRDPADPDVEYFLDNLNDCRNTVYSCERGWRRFLGECGCGCYAAPIRPCEDREDCGLAEVCDDDVCVGEPQ